MAMQKENFLQDTPTSQDLSVQEKQGDQHSQNIENHEASDNDSSVSINDSNVVVKSFGIRRSELIMTQFTSTWQKVFFCFTIFLGMYIISVENYCVNTLVSYATNSYREHSLMSTIRIVGYVASAGSYPFFARAADIFGRLPLFIVALLFKIMGLIIQAKAVDVQKYCAGSVFFSIGNSAETILWQLCIADATSLRFRGLFLIAMSLPTVVNTWSIGEIVNQLVLHHSWSFGIALWSYVSTIVCLPFVFFYFWLFWKARKTEAWKIIIEEEHQAYIAANPRARRAHQQLNDANSFGSKSSAYLKIGFFSFIEGVWTIFWAIDLIGNLLLVVALGLLLVPLTLAGGANAKWKQAHTIVPLVLVVIAIPLFLFWETKVTSKPLIPFKLMRDRGVYAPFLIGIFTTFVYDMPNAFAYPVLLVGMNASVTVATRTPALAAFAEGIASPIIGLIIVKVRRTKALIFIGVAMMFIAMGLFVHFRGSNDGIRAKYFRDGIAISMCFQGVADACLLRTVATSLQSCTNHEYMASVTAIFSLCYLVGMAVGSSVSGAIWTQQMYGTIVKKMVALGVDPQNAVEAYYSPYSFIMFHPWGTPARRAVSMAYAEVQRKLSIVGVCLCVILLVLVFFLRDHRLPDAQNFGDDKSTATASGTEIAEGPVVRDKSQIVFTDDKDYILDFMQKLLPWRRQPMQ